MGARTAPMASHESAPLNSASRNLLVAAVVVLIAIGAATAFAVGFSGALEDSLANPSSAPALRIAALERLRDVLGSDGFLKSYRALPITGDAAGERELARLAGEARAALANLRAASENDHDWAEAKSIGSMVAIFDRAARDRAAGAAAPDPAALEQSYAALKPRLAQALDSARYRRIETLSHAFALSQTLAVLALTALSLTLFGLAWFVRTRLLGPLRALRHSTEQAADGGLFRHLWGIDRKDEIGTLARAINRLRRQLAAESDEPGSPAGEIRAVLENRPYRRAGDAESIGATRRIETDLESILAAMDEARNRIEEASRDAARASQTAVEAADLARAGTERLNAKAERSLLSAGTQAQALLAALTSSVTRLGKAAARLEAAPLAPAGTRAPTQSITGRARSLLSRLQTADGEAENAVSAPAEENVESDIYAALSRLADANDRSGRDCAAPLAGLSADLDTLETLARRDGGIAESEAAVLTAALIEAIDRLNGVVERVASATQRKPPRGTGRI